MGVEEWLKESCIAPAMDMPAESIPASTVTDLIRRAWSDAVAEEREACARLAESHVCQWIHLSANEDYIGGNPPGEIAAAIRARCT